MTVGKGRFTTMSCMQKLNTRNSATAELAAADDAVVMTSWNKSFLEVQGHRIHKNISCQDDKSTVSLEENDKRSSSNRFRHSNIHHFFLTNQVKKKTVSIDCCPTDDMNGDFVSKPLQGAKFRKFRNELGMKNC